MRRLRAIREQRGISLRALKKASGVATDITLPKQAELDLKRQVEEASHELVNAHLGERNDDAD